MISIIKKNLKDAMIAREKERVETLRNILAKLRLVEIEKKGHLDESECIKVLQTMSKQLKDSIEQYTKGNRTDLADIESTQLKIVTEFLPEKMSSDELTSIVLGIIKDTNASSMKDMGRVMGLVISKTKGRADGSEISSIVKENLSWIH